MTKLAELKKQLMKNPEVRREYEIVDAEYTLIEEMIRARMNAHLSQSELAVKIGTTQSAIARLESGRVSSSFATLLPYADCSARHLKFGFF